MRKIALPVGAGNNIDNHFGHCQFYAVYTVAENNEIIEVETIPSPQGCGCKSDIAGRLSEQGVTLMLAGGIGDGAIQVLGKHGIDVLRGCQGNATEIVRQFLEGNITDNGESCRQHQQHHGHGHDHDHGHTCPH